MTPVQPNQLFIDEAEMERWLAVHLPGATVVRTWKVERICCEVMPAPLQVALPMVCEATNCLRFDSRAAAAKFNDEQCGHLPILAMWRCKKCNGGWHMWCLTAHSDSSGALPAGMSIEVPERIRKLIAETEMVSS
jgi:hypothetical protein